MKMKQETFKTLSQYIHGELIEIGLTMEELKDWYNICEMNMERMRWDLFYSKLGNSSFRRLIVNTYNDNHIDTALRKITQTN